MENNNFSLDVSPKKGYNVGNDIYDAVVEHYLAQPQIVKMDEQAPVNDSQHDHQLVADPEDRLGTATYHGCVKPKCGVGFYIQPTIK